jgi:hypothetical protein
MWCVAEIDEPYIARMEDVLELYERPHDPQETVVCFDEKPLTLHAEVRPRQAVPSQPPVVCRRTRLPGPATLPNAIPSINAAEPRILSVP